MNSIVIVGRPNVGKSTLFNRLVGHKRSIVHDEPGVTRDCIFARMEVHERPVCLIDTGGFIPGQVATGFERLVVDQVQRGLTEADILLVVFDGRAGRTPGDEDIVQELRQLSKPMIGVVNKVDPGAKVDSSEFEKFGIPLVEISAEHGRGIDELRDEIAKLLPKELGTDFMPETKDAIRVAFVGRPNVGKSSLINAILDEPRMLVSEMPGTTRDVVDIFIQKDAHQFVLLDTAGIRRKLKIVDTVEHYSAVRSLRAIEQADVVVLVLEATKPITTQDERIAAAVLDKGSGLLLAANKWDLVKDHKNTRHHYRDDVFNTSAFVSFAALKFVSAKTGLGVDQVLIEAWRISQRKKKVFSKEDLETVFESICANHTQAGLYGSKIRLVKLTQAKDERIATFFVWCNDPRFIATDFARYWTNALGRALKLEGVPIRVVFRRLKASGRPRKEGRKTKFRSRRARV